MKTKIALLVLMLSAALMSFGQSPVKVTGTVTDDNGEALIGVSITAKGVNSGVTSDLDGNYVIQIPVGTTLVYSYIGYESAERKVGAAGEINVTLRESSTALNDVVVVGYGVQKKSSVTGAISQVKAEDIENRTVTNPKSALQGKTAGVQVVTSSAPGSSPTIRVRGYSSNVSSDPLYVVDGVRLSDISGIDPNDIASMEVLKDAASAAIYGAEAGNGVVLITTKRGSEGNGKISYDFQYTWERPSKIPRMLNAEQYIQYMSEGNFFTEDYLLKNWDGVTNTAWIDEAFETGHMQRHNLSFTNGNERGNYYLSLSYLDNNGIVGGNSDLYQRLTAAINAEYNIKTWLKVGTTNQIEKYNIRQVSESNEYGSLITATLLMDPLTPFKYAPENLPLHMINAVNQGKTLLTDKDGNYYGVSQFLNAENYHPFVMRDSNVSRNGGFNITGSIFADFKPFDGFTFTSRLGYRMSASHSANISLPFYGNATQNRDWVSIPSATNSQTVYWQWENFANYNRQFGVNTISAMLGMSYSESVNSYTQGSLSSVNDDALKKNDPLFWYLNYAKESATKGVGGEKTRSSKMSYFGRVSYEYDNRYHIQASLRADAADLSKLPLENRWGYFPAVSAGWTMSNEKFFDDARRYVDIVKIRASWGQNGSLAALGGYPYSTDMVISGFYPLVPGNNYTNAVAPGTMGNNKLKWETSEQFDLGLDMRFLRNRLGFTFDWYTKKTKDLLVNGTVPSLIIGGTTSPMNAGNVSNKGVEIELSWRDYVGDFRYSASFNLATLKNEVTYLDPSIARIPGSTFHTSTITYFEKGYPVYYFRGYKFDGLDENGNPRFKDLDNSGTLNDGDIDYIGDAIPDITYGLTLNLGWKGLDLTVFGTGAAGNKVFNCINRADYPQSNKLKEVFYDNRWTPENLNGTVPRAGADNMDKYSTSDALVYDGSYFKIKQIQLGYMIPQKWTSKAYISNLRIYASLDDFFCFTKYPGFDPEVAANATAGMGIDKGAYPSSKKVVLGFNITF